MPGRRFTFRTGSANRVALVTAVFVAIELGSAVAGHGFPDQGWSWLIVELLVAGAITFGLAAVVGVALAARGIRLFWLPLAVSSFAVVVLSRGAPPAPIGVSWGWTCLGCSTPFLVWIGATTELALVAAAGWPLLRDAGRDRPAARPDQVDIAFAVLVAAVAWTIQHAAQVIGDAPPTSGVVAVAAAGILLGTRRRWAPWICLLFVLPAVGDFPYVLTGVLHPFAGNSTWDAIRESAPPVIALAFVALAASSGPLIRRVVERGDDHPLELAFIVNGLNLADAILTAAVVRSGGGEELNPVVRWLGLPAKVILVGLLTWILLRANPRAHAIPALVLTWVLTYHVAGLFVNG